MPTTLKKGGYGYVACALLKFPIKISTSMQALFTPPQLATRVITQDRGLTNCQLAHVTTFSKCKGY
jgi:hypothetical protein